MLFGLLLVYHADTNALAKHWHGLFQRTTAYEDGPAFVTQCPISPSASYQYVIPTLDQAGTHW
jgi:iron transport multicopper oxidase